MLAMYELFTWVEPQTLSKFTMHTAHLDNVKLKLNLMFVVCG